MVLLVLCMFVSSFLCFCLYRRVDILGAAGVSALSAPANLWASYGNRRAQFLADTFKLVKTLTFIQPKMCLVP